MEDFKKILVIISSKDLPNQCYVLETLNLRYVLNEISLTHPSREKLEVYYTSSLKPTASFGKVLKKMNQFKGHTQKYLFMIPWQRAKIILEESGSLNPEIKAAPESNNKLPEVSSKREKTNLTVVSDKVEKPLTLPEKVQKVSPSSGNIKTDKAVSATRESAVPTTTEFQVIKVPVAKQIKNSTTNEIAETEVKQLKEPSVNGKLSEYGVTYLSSNIYQYLDIFDCAVCEIYIYLPNNCKYITFLNSGSKFTDEKKYMLDNAIDPRSFINVEELMKREESFLTTVKDFESNPIPRNVVRYVRGAQKLLLKKNLDDPKQVLSGLNVISDKLIEEILPLCKKDLLKSFTLDKYHLDEARSLCGLSIMFAMAAQFSSDQSFKDLTLACLLMDTSLANVDQFTMKRYFSKDDDISSDLREKFRLHSEESAKITSERLPGLRETVKQLILCHHERYDGSGYPKKLKGTDIFPLGQVLCLAIHVYEVLKYKEAANNPTSILDGLKEIGEPVLEGISTAHSKHLIQMVFKYFKTDSKIKKAA